MQVLNIFHVLIAIALIVFVLIQKGQGATAGAAFGSGASGTVFGARGAGNFLSRTTWVLAGLFCAISLTMAVMVSRIMTADEPDLGVVSATQQEQIVEEAERSEPMVGSDEPVAIDMPSFEQAVDSGATGEAAAEAVEDMTTEDLPAVEDGEEVPGQGGEEG